MAAHATVAHPPAEGGESDDDVDVLRAAAAGDPEATRSLFRRHADRVFRCAVRILGHDDGDVDDVVQQTFLAALDGASSYDGRGRVGTWLVGIATRRALDHARSRWRRGRWARITERVGLGRPAPHPDRHDDVALAEAALGRLTPDQRTVFLLHEVEGYTFGEIREMTGTGISTLHARLQAARRRLDAVLPALLSPDGDRS
ncbi:MAG: RNA polymerase sigma factor [Sandaracinaceae bacterium]